MNEVQKNLNHLMGKKDIQIFKDKSGMIYVSISGKQGMAVQAYPLHSRLLTINLKKYILPIIMNYCLLRISNTSVNS